MVTRKTSYWVAISVLIVAASASFQHPFGTQTPEFSRKGLKEDTVRSTPPIPLSTHHAYDDGLFTPIEDLSTLSETDFTLISHPFFPNVGARIKKTKFCDQTVNSYTGYIDVQARHLFFYFFESRRNPDRDDVIFWTNGGPGCSSATGLFMELGPCRMADGGNNTRYFPESWNTNANVFFIDQPVGVGFSYAEFGEKVETSEDAAEDIAAFVAIFFENFTKFRGRRFHMAGESYGGRYIPLFASAVYSQNAELIEAGLSPINLVSVMIGNGFTEPHSMLLSYYDMLCTDISVPPVMDIGSCVRMKQIMPRCVKRLKESCEDIFDIVDCEAATRFCELELSDPFFTTGKNPYDLSKVCEGGSSHTSCYPIIKNISAYLNAPSTRALLGVDPSLDSLPFSSCSMLVGTSFTLSHDQLRTSHLHVAALLERDIRVLVYVGTYDWMCNWIGNERWTLELEWSGHGEFAAEGLREWLVDNERVGLTRGQGGLVYATVEGAGHMVPYDKPKEALALVNRWLEGIEL